MRCISVLLRTHVQYFDFMLLLFVFYFDVVDVAGVTVINVTRCSDLFSVTLYSAGESHRDMN